MPPKRKIKQERIPITVHTKISYYALIIAIIIEFYLFLRHPEESFGQLAGFEAIMGITALLLLDTLRSGKLTFLQKRLQPPNKSLFFRTMVIFLVIAVIQIVFQFIPLSIRPYEYMLAIVFCAPIEEAFFRGLLNEPFYKLSKSTDGFNLLGKRMSFVELMGIFISSFCFGIFHINYYSSSALMFIVFVGGVWLGFCYWWWRDLTSLILAHFALNLIAVGQLFYLVNLG